MSGARAPFKQRLKQALASERLPNALERTLGSISASPFADPSEAKFQAVRAEVTERKRGALARLPELVERFREEAEKAGVTVHCAADAEEARRVVGAIARQNGVQIAVNVGSATPREVEEIELNDFLAALGVDVVDVEPGEGLRQRCTDADMVITGCDIAVAESGALVIADDERACPLTSTLPVHIAMLGIEKIVPTFDDAIAMLTVLSPDAAEEKQPSNVRFVSWPGRTGDSRLSLATGVPGPKQTHVVLVDNGRTAMLRNPAFSEALRCIHCAACSSVCPPFDAVGSRAFGHIYNGPIGLVLTPWYHGVEAAAGPQSLCFSCNACETVCPASIPLPRLIVGVREHVAKLHKAPLAKRVGLELLEEPRRFGMAGPVGALLQRPLGKGGGFVAGPFLPGSDWRHLPALPPRPFRDTLARREREGAVLAKRQQPLPGSRAAGMRVAYFAGCLTDRFYPEMGRAVVRLLQACGCEVVFPPGQACCGLTAANSGERERAVAMAKQTIGALQGARVDYIVSASTSCVAAMIQDYPHTLAAEPVWVERATTLAARVIDLSRFLDRVAQPPPGALAGGRCHRPTYHDSCQSFNCLEVSGEARRLISDVAGDEVVEMSESSVCCGFGGTTSFEHPEVAKRIAARKLAHIAESGASLVVADDPGCVLQLRGALHARGSATRVQHLAEYLADRLQPAAG